MSVLIVGSTNMDISATMERFPTKGETLLGNSISFQYGGKGANQACALGKLGADATFLTCVGDDSYGYEMVNYLKETGVNMDRVKYSSTHKTGTAIINVDARGNNTIVVIQGANLDCDVDYIRANEECFRSCDYVLLQMEIPIDAIEEAILMAAKYGKKVILNPAPASNQLSKDLYKYITYMTPNEVEVGIMAGQEGDPEQNAEKLLKLGVQNVLVTLGEKGSHLYSRNHKSIYVPACEVDAVDTVAAGDCFNGAFAAALDRGESEGGAMEFANRASAIAVTRRGAQESMPTKEELETMSFR